MRVPGGKGFGEEVPGGTGKVFFRKALVRKALPGIVMAATALAPSAASAQAVDTIPATEIDADWLERLPVPPLVFEVARPTETEVNGVTVFFIEDHELPLVNLYLSFEGGYGDFPRESFAAALGLPSLMRSGGTETLPPDSVEVRIEGLALQTTLGSGGGSISASLNTPVTSLPTALEIFGDMLARPGFDSARVELWRGQELEASRRSADNPGTVAFSTFNRLLHGDHPIGWEMRPSDLTPQRFGPSALERVHQRLVCRDRMLVGVTGDVTWEQIRPRIDALIAQIPTCPGSLEDPPVPVVGAEPGVYIVPRDLEQATVVLAHPVGLREGDGPDYFASQIGTSILGASGLTSRLMQRVRTERGLAYGASSLWTTPRRYDGLLGAIVRTGPETTVEAIEVVLQTMQSMAEAPPTEVEVSTLRDQLANGWIFNFDTPGVVVSRRMAFRMGDLPDDWLEQYLRGIQAVEPEEIQGAFQRWLRISEMVILIVGDPERIGPGLERFGPVQTLDPADPGLRPPPSGWPQSRR